ncbi:hypothetical protein CDEST_07805 [Colletotrichum destructivum]|uniref:Uncharacterized protein n=1 Tax=Colletotrichum destructivum TaxID=34406 RepID=A0AAX4IHE2_9PEZI|nr:hypothetical protein CDEST_07805 [Colletotrichum destructivum]
MGRVQFDWILPPSVLAPINFTKGIVCSSSSHSVIETCSFPSSSRLWHIPEATVSPSSLRQPWPTATHPTALQTLLLSSNGAAAPRLLCRRVEHAKRVVVRLNQFHQRQEKRPDRQDVYNPPRRERRRSVAGR